MNWPLTSSLDLSFALAPAHQASAIDTSNFDPEFTNETPMDSVVDDSHMLSATVQEQFVGFSYNAPNDLHQGESMRD